MEGLKSWAFSFCCAAVAGAMLSLLAPDSSLGRVCRFSIRVFLLCCLLLPVGRFGEIARTIPALELQNQAAAERISQVLSEQIAKDTASSIETQVGEILTEEGVPYQKIEAIVNTTKDGGISIDCIRILPPQDIREDSPETLYQEALELVKAKTGVSVEFAAENGGRAP